MGSTVLTASAKMHGYFYICNVLQNFLISLFAPLNVGAFFISTVALFHSLAASILRLSLAAFVFAESFHCFVVVCLTLLSFSSLFGLLTSSLNGYSSTCVAFHASVSFISPASWLAEGSLYFCNSVR